MGHCVTNPGTREPTVTASSYATLQAISEGRMVMGIGRGDSARRVIGYKPVKVAEFEAALVMMKDLMNGKPVEWNGKDLQLEWAQAPSRDPDVHRRLRAEGARGRRDASATASSSSSPTRSSSSGSWSRRAPPRRRRARSRRAPVPRLRAEHHHRRHAGGPRRVRWFPAMVSNHVMDLIERYGFESEIPRSSPSTSRRASSTTTRTTAAKEPRTASSSPTRSPTASP